MQAEIQRNTNSSIRRCLLAGGTVASLMLFGIGGWATTTELAGAVIAPGLLIVESNVKKVQHPTGGVIGDLRVRDGTAVSVGDIVVRLDETIARSNLFVLVKSMDELSARQARLMAEQEGRDSVSFSHELLTRSNDPSVIELLKGEKHLFELRRAARIGQQAQLTERTKQLREQIQGLSEQVGAKKREIDLIEEELKGVRGLWKQNLVPITRITALERDAARLEGERGALISTIAQTKGRIVETELQIIQIEQDLRSEVGKDLAEIRGKLSELLEKRVAAEDQLSRIDIRAPQDGIVHQLAVHTIGGVISPGEPIMLIIPRADALTVEARISPKDIDQIRMGQRAILRFSAFNQSTTPELNGEVRVISADISVDQKSGASFYTVRITPPKAELTRLNLKLVPGMPVECFIQTGGRTVLSYLTKPVEDQIMRSWREK
jgi:HlyD family secretion protein